jgi:hypothetical protein
MYNHDQQHQRERQNESKYRDVREYHKEHQRGLYHKEQELESHVSNQMISDPKVEDLTEFVKHTRGAISKEYQLMPISANCTIPAELSLTKESSLVAESSVVEPSLVAVEPSLVAVEPSLVSVEPSLVSVEPSLVYEEHRPLTTAYVGTGDCGHVAVAKRTPPFTSNFFDWAASSEFRVPEPSSALAQSQAAAVEEPSSVFEDYRNGFGYYMSAVANLKSMDIAITPEVSNMIHTCKGDISAITGMIFGAY